MNLDQVRVKLFKRILSPVEILYDISSHWFIVILAFALGTLWMVAKVTTEPPIYEANSTLVLNSNELILDEAAAKRYSAPRDAAEAFMGEQLSLLRSDSVIDKVIGKLGGVEKIIAQEDDPRGLDKLGFIQRKFRQLQDVAYSVALYFDTTGPQPEKDKRLQQAKSAFRRTSQVISDRKSNIVKLQVIGTVREGLDAQLNAWIEAYRARVGEISKAAYENLFKERIEYWTGEVRLAKAALDKFRSDHREINFEMKKFNDEKLVKLHLFKEDLIRGIPVDPGRAASLLTPGGGPSADETALIELRRKKAELEVEMASLKVNYTEGSDKIKAKRAEIEEVARMVLELESKVLTSRNSVQNDSEKKIEDREKEAADARQALQAATLADREKRIDDEINRLMLDNSRIEEKLPELNDFIAEHKRAQEVLNRFRSLQDQKTEQAEVRKLVDIVVQDPPVTTFSPRGNYSLRVGTGALAGLSVGLVLAFSREFFSRKIRYKRDVEEELGLKVVGVIPEN